ncbi:MAG: cytochrome P450 [Pseudonocardiaceae bacterium]
MVATRMLAPAPPESGLAPIAGDRGLPLIGYTWQVLHDPLGVARRRYELHGPVSWFNSFGARMVVLLGPDAAGVALGNRDRAFSNGGAWDYFLGPFFRRGVLLLDFDEHRHHRRIMQQAFTPARLAGYLTAMNPSIAAGLQNWTPGPGFRVYPAVKRLTLDLATDIFMGGVHLDVRAEQINRAFIDCVRAATAYVRTSVPGGRWRRGLIGRRMLEDFLYEHLPSVRDRNSDDLFAALCRAESEDGHRFTDTDVVNHMILLLMAAHDTTTATITTIMEYLSRYPEWQQRCRTESSALGTAPLGYADLDALVSLDLVMKEALRLVVPVPWLPRKTVADTEVLGHFLPAGTMVTIGMHFTHHMAEYWPDPERFDPERFAEHRREDKVHRFAWVPFGGGVHKCIGLYFAGVQIKAVLHQLLLRYRWSTPPGYQAPMDYTSLPRPKDGLPVQLERI